GAAGKVRVLERAADDFSGMEGEQFDAVVLNSVAQYFPSLEYLEAVLEGAVKVVAGAGGFVFVGDVRSLPLLQTLHASVEVCRAAGSESLRLVAERAREQAGRELELSIDPEYFLRLKGRLKRLGEVRVLHKRGRYQNELTRYRYDVVLEVKRAAEKSGEAQDGRAKARSAECRVVQWEPSLTAEAMCELLRKGEAPCVRVAGVKNARLVGELKAARVLFEDDRAGQVKELRELLRAGREAEHAVDPEDVYESLLSAGHEVEVRWSGTGREDSFDVLMWRRGVRALEEEDWAGREAAEGEAERRYSNDPLRSLGSVNLTQQLRRYVGEHLPAYMVPSSIVLLESMPLTPNKKIDRRALSALEKTEGVEERTYEPPRNEVEEVVAGIWAEVLGVERVGVHDNFFDLGGHSLLAIQIAMRMQKMGFEMKSQQLFKYHTIAELAEILVLPGRRPAPSESEQDGLLSAALETAAAPTAAAPGVAVQVEEPELPADGQLEFYDPRKVFLTGATGYLGAYLLRELLQQTDAEVYYLVRAASKEAGENRLREQLAWYFPDSVRDEAWRRVVPVPGDLRSPRLGLSPEDYRSLCDTMDAVYHSAADVRHIGDEDDFNATNVNGTRLMVELARTGKRKVLHHISTIYVGGLQGDSGHRVFREQDFDIRQELEAYPYLQSKFLAERVVREAMTRGCDAVIHRTGNITADSHTGRFQRNIQENVFYRTMRAITMIGVAPYVSGVPIEVTPVDFIAKGIVNLSRVRHMEGQTFHYINPHQLELYDLIRTLHAIGYPIRLVNPDEFLKMIWASGGRSEYEADLIHFIGFFGGGNIKPLEVDGSYTRGWLKRLGIECAPPSSAWLSLMVQHCIEVQYLPSPAGREGAGAIPELLRD
ncbi:MAG: thioester reductase domain-containing protein, partial [Pyrinomonadaceae bacterium]